MMERFDDMIKSKVKDLVNCKSKTDILGTMECIKEMILLDMKYNLKL